jgi:Family of unknown function (DUF5343)
MAESESDILPVYLSFPTFQSAVNNLRSHGLPPKLDRSAWGSRSGAEQGQIISAFKFLGFIDSEGNTQASLRKYVDAEENSEEEKQLMAEMLKARYSRLFESVDLQSATPKQLIDAIASYGTSGATKDRAVRFFLKAADHAKVPLSSRLTTGMRSRSTGSANGNNSEDSSGSASRQQRRKRTKPAVTGCPSNDGEEESATGNAVKTIELRESGGTLTLSGTFNAFELDGEDRKLVYDIIDLMKRYEKGANTGSEFAK